MQELGGKPEGGLGTHDRLTELVRCTKCGEKKSRDSFADDPRKKNGLTSWCCLCRDNRKKQWDRDHPELVDAARKRHRAKLKAQVYAKFGNRCNNPECSTPGGCTDVRCLQIDHVHNDGHKERRPNGSRPRYRILREALNDTEGRFQLLCANCNTIKAWENRCRPDPKTEPLPV